MKGGEPLILHTYLVKDSTLLDRVTCECVVFGISKGPANTGVDVTAGVPGGPGPGRFELSLALLHLTLHLRHMLLFSYD